MNKAGIGLLRAPNGAKELNQIQQSHFDPTMGSNETSPIYHEALPAVRQA